MAARTKSITRVLNHPGAVQGYTGAQHAVPVAVASSGGVLSLDFKKHQEVNWTLTETTAEVGAMTNHADGRTVAINIIGVSGKAITWNANWKRNSDKAMPAAPAAGKRMTVYGKSDGTYTWLQGVSSEV